jgi:ribosome-associated translation inhibitor RaiA
MQIQINTDANIKSSAGFQQQIEATVGNALGHLAEHITRVEVHLSDENSQKGGNSDKRCMIEARLEGRNPDAVTDEASTIEQAVNGAVEKIKSLLESRVERLRNY